MTDAPKIRWGMIGVGNIGSHALVPAIRAAQDAELLAVASRTQERATALATEHAITRAYGSYEQLVADRDIDAVYIGLPNGLHEEWATRCAAAGKHVLCEKALTLTYASAIRMNEACKHAGVLLQEAFMYRHHPQWDQVRKVLASGVLGRVVMVQAMLSGNLEKSNPADHRWSASMGGGALFDVTCYGIDIARYILAAEPLAISAMADTTTPEGVDRTSTVTMRFPNDVLALATGSLGAHHNQFARVVGSNGTLEIPKPVIPGCDSAHITFRCDGKPDETINVAGADHFQLQVENFCRAIRERTLVFPAENGLANSVIHDAVLASIAGRTTISLS